MSKAEGRGKAQKHFSWHFKIKRHVERVAMKFLKKPRQGKMLAALLQDCASQIDELYNHTHTRILEKYPDIPVRYFSDAVRVPYRVGLKRYKSWHLNKGIMPPLTGRTSVASRAKWATVVMEELGL